jgi:hypothetical protein
LQKNTFEIGTGAIALSFSASSIAGSWLFAGEQVREGELAHLRGGGLDQLLVAVAERCAPQPGHALDIGLAAGIVDIHTVRALDDKRPGLAEAREIDIGVHQCLDVTDGEIAEWRHESESPLESDSRRCSRLVWRQFAALL